MLAAAARRFVTLLAAIVGGTALLALLLGLLLGASPSRSVAVGLYLVGSRASCSVAFFVGNRGMFRVANEEGMVGLRVPRGVRVASGDEQVESFNMTGLLVVTGIVLLALGAAVDSNARLL